MTIRPLVPEDVARCVALGEAAWRPVYDDLRRLDGDDLFRRLWPDWARPRAGAIEELATADDRQGWVAIDDGDVAGFAIAIAVEATGLGEVNMVAVAPDHQGRGAGSALVRHAVAELRRAGIAHVLAITRTVPAHDPARRVFAKSGFASLPTQTIQFGLPLDDAGAGGSPPPGVRPIAAADPAACRAFGVEAFRPVFASMERHYGPDLFARLRPDWEQAQADYIEAACADPEKDTWVFEHEGALAGFVVMTTGDRGVGRIEVLAVDPARQGGGVGTTLNRFAVGRLRDAGMAYAVVGTGSDSGHAPARRSYEKIGFRPLAVQWDLLAGAF